MDIFALSFLAQEIDALLRGLVLGVLIAAPVGPSALLVIKRSLVTGPQSGIATGLGAALADAFYGAIAAFSVTALVQWFAGYDVQIRLVGGALLLAIGYIMLRRAPPSGLDLTAEKAAASPQKTGLPAAFGSGFALTATNPMMLLAVIPVVAALGGQRTALEAGILTAGIFLGSLLWWCFLAFVASLFRSHMGPLALRRISQATALIILLCGLWAILSGLFPLSFGGMLLSMPHG